MFFLLVLDVPKMAQKPHIKARFDISKSREFLDKTTKNYPKRNQWIRPPDIEFANQQELIFDQDSYEDEQYA